MFARVARCVPVFGLMSRPVLLDRPALPVINYQVNLSRPTARVDMQMHRRLMPLPIVFSLAILLSSCQTDKIDLKDARETSILLSGGTLTAPPRSVDGLLERLGSRPPNFLNELNTLQKQVASPVDTSLQGADRARALAARAEAASKLGQAQTAIDYWKDVMAASEALKGAVGYLDRSDWAWRYSLALRVGGRVGDSLAQLEQALRIVRAGKPGSDYFLEGRTHGRVSVFEALLATQHLSFGNVEEAKAALSRANNARARFQSIVDLGRTHGVAFSDSLLIEIEMAEAVTKSASAELTRLKGDLTNAERLFREARGNLRTESKAVGGYAANAQRKLWQYISARLAVTLRDQGQFVKAESAAREALDDALRTHGPTGLDTVRALLTLNDILIARRRFDSALRLLAAALPSLDDAAGGQVSEASFQARRQLAIGLAGTQKWKDAAATMRKLERAVEKSGANLAPLTKSDLTRAIIFLRAGQYDDALRAARDETKWAQSVYGADHPNTAESRGDEAAALWFAGHADEAREILDEVAPELATARAGQYLSVRGNPLQAERLRAVLDATVGVSTHTDVSGRLDTAFRLAQVIGESSVMAAIAATAARNAIQDPTLADQVRREQDQTREVEALYGTLQSAINLAADRRPAGLLPAIRSRIQAAERTLAEHRDQLAADTRRVAPEPVPIAAVQRTLQQGEALILIEQSATATYVWGLSHEGSVRFAVSPLGREDISATVDHLRQALAPENVTRAADIPAFDASRAYELYRHLLAPVQSAWEDAETLFIVANGNLATLPFTLLPTSPVDIDGATDGLLFSNYRDVSWLVRKHSVAQLPTVQALVSLRNTARPSRKNAFAGFGDPIFADDSEEATNASTRGGAFALSLRSRPSTLQSRSAGVTSLPRLPDTGTEISRIADILGAQPARDIHLGLAASESRIRRLNDAGDLASYRIISFATHGLRAGDLDGLAEPALAMTNPKILGEADDGLLTMSEIFRLTLNADLAILSACNTAAGESGSSEAVSGLGRAFFYAGARAVMISNWPVFSPSTLEFMVSMFDRQGVALSQAYRAGMIGLIDDGIFRNDDGRPVFSYAHPLFWAPFSLAGDSAGDLRPDV